MIEQLIEKGGPVMIAIIAVSIVLYSRCLRLLATLWVSLRQTARTAPDPVGMEEIRVRCADIEALFRRERVVLGSMIAAAPLLGLLGTVSGMAKTFASLMDRGQAGSMEGFARGISEVLTATESGLLVAIPGLLLVCLAQHGVRRNLRALNRLEAQLRASPLR